MLGTVGAPSGADGYWFSLFLDCFPEDDVRSILRCVRAATRPDSRAFVLDTYWHQQ